jgi:hypothetical protein
MPPQAFALVVLFLVCSVLLGIGAQRLVARVAHGPRGWRASILPIAASFGAFYLIGHRLGLAVGPEVSLFGFQVALPGDLAIGFLAGLVVALVQAAAARARRGPAGTAPA